MISERKSEADVNNEMEHYSPSTTHFLFKSDSFWAQIAFTSGGSFSTGPVRGSTHFFSQWRTVKYLPVLTHDCEIVREVKLWRIKIRRLQITFCFIVICQ